MASSSEGRSSRLITRTLSAYDFLNAVCVCVCLLMSKLFACLIDYELPYSAVTDILQQEFKDGIRNHC